MNYEIRVMSIRQVVDKFKSHVVDTQLNELDITVLNDVVSGRPLPQIIYNQKTNQIININVVKSLWLAFKNEDIFYLYNNNLVTTLESKKSIPLHIALNNLKLYYWQKNEQLDVIDKVDKCSNMFNFSQISVVFVN